MSVRTTKRRPCWDAARRELWFGALLVKWFRKYARNQELLLQAFQECGWPAEIDDPLLVSLDILPEERLRETVKRLNRSVAAGTIRFGVCKNGRRAYWRVIKG